MAQRYAYLLARHQDVTYRKPAPEQLDFMPTSLGVYFTVGLRIFHDLPQTVTLFQKRKACFLPQSGTAYLARKRT